MALELSRFNLEHFFSLPSPASALSLRNSVVCRQKNQLFFLELNSFSSLFHSHQCTDSFNLTKSRDCAQLAGESLGVSWQSSVWRKHSSAGGWLIVDSSNFHIFHPPTQSPSRAYNLKRGEGRVRSTHNSSLMWSEKHEKLTKDLWSVQILSENAVLLSLTLNKRANFFPFRYHFSFRLVLFSIIYFIFYHHRSLSSHWLWACGWIINTQKWIHISRQSRKRQSRVTVMCHVWTVSPPPPSSSSHFAWNRKKKTLKFQALALRCFYLIYFEFSHNFAWQKNIIF